ncbi:Carboxypeptidase regulatory-like domain-containing protein [Halorientalis persicus]|uniref:Carboxypeptidase regulatory-like domain-containing protein n=2 Tax=Halorientalis persicus TaxID=1367881 RepID=A0A1H8W760_9EURY|nr:Carboxypeptidase regulatory-like domain-containing protein [Halorientalis persicus]
MTSILALGAVGGAGATDTYLERDGGGSIQETTYSNQSLGYLEYKLSEQDTPLLYHTRYSSSDTNMNKVSQSASEFTCDPEAFSSPPNTYIRKIAEPRNHIQTGQSYTEGMDLAVKVEWECVSDKSRDEIVLKDLDGTFNANDDLITFSVNSGSGSKWVNIPYSEIESAVSDDNNGDDLELRSEVNYMCVSCFSDSEKKVVSQKSTQIFLENVPDTVTDGISTTARIYGWSQKNTVEWKLMENDPLLDKKVKSGIASTNGNSFETTVPFTPSKYDDNLGDPPINIYAKSLGNGDTTSEFPIAISEGNSPPVADFTTEPARPKNPGETFLVDPSASSDPDGDEALMTYKWDWDNDGEYETTSSGVTSHSFDTETDQTITLQAKDENGGTDTITKTIDMNRQPNAVPTWPVPDVPSDQSRVEVELDGSDSNDADGTVTSWDWTIKYADGSVRSTPTGVSPSVQLSPGSYEVTLKVADNNDGTDSVTGSLNIDSANRPPTADAGPDKTVKEEGTVTLDGGGSSDPDGDSLSYSWEIISGSEHGSLVTQTGEEVYFNADKVETDQSVDVRLTVDDGISDTADSTDTVSITINAENEPPNADNISVSTQEGSAVSGHFDASDPDGDSLSYALTNGSDHGSVTSSGDSFTYTPNTGFSGTDTFRYRVTDGNGGEDTAQVDISVSATNTPPIASDMTVSTAEGTSISDQFDASDPDGDSLSYSVISSPDHGRVSISSDSFTYTPDSGHSGLDSFTYEVTDGNGGRDLATVNISVKDTESQSFEIRGLETNAPVSEGQPVEIVATIENAGDQSGRQTIDLSIPGVGSDQVSVQLAPGESTQRTFRVSTSSGDAGDYTAEVSSRDDSATIPITVESDTQDGYIAVDVTAASGESLENVDVTVIDSEGSIVAEETIDSVGASIRVDPGDYTVRASKLGYTAGSDTVSVSSGGTNTASIVLTTLQEPEAATFEVTNLDAPAQIENRTGLSVEQFDVSATIENTGGTKATQTVEASTSLVSVTEQVSLSPGEQQTVTFRDLGGFGVAGDTVGVTVRTDDDSMSADLDVVTRDDSGSGGSIIVTVLNQSFQELENIQVKLYRENGGTNLVSTDETGPDGRVSFADLPVGTSEDNSVRYTAVAGTQSNRYASDAEDLELWEPGQTGDSTTISLQSASRGTNDQYEPNDNIDNAVQVLPGQYSDLQIVNGESDYYKVHLSKSASLAASIDYQHQAGNLDMRLYGPNKQPLDSSTSWSSGESVSANSVETGGTYYIEINGDNGATASYSLKISIEGPTQRAAITGDVTTAEGQPLSGATVTLRPVDTNTAIDTSKTGESGSYAFTNVPVSTGNADGYILEATFNGETGQSTINSLPAGTTTLDITVPGSNIGDEDDTGDAIQLEVDAPSQVVPGQTTTIDVRLRNTDLANAGGGSISLASVPAPLTIAGEDTKFIGIDREPPSIGETTTATFELSIPDNAATGDVTITADGQLQSETQTATTTTSTTLTIAEQSGSRFNTNGQPGIQSEEIVNAIVAYNTNREVGNQDVTSQDVIDLIVRYNTA